MSSSNVANIRNDYSVNYKAIIANRKLNNLSRLTVKTLIAEAKKEACSKISCLSVDEVIDGCDLRVTVSGTIKTKHGQSVSNNFEPLRAGCVGLSWDNVAKLLDVAPLSTVMGLLDVNNINY